MNWINYRRYPIDQTGTTGLRRLVTTCRQQLANNGMFTLAGFLMSSALCAINRQLDDQSGNAFTHAREHNIYFDDALDLDKAHPAMRRVRTVNHTLCADQLESSPITRVYENSHLIDFLTAVTGKPVLFVMQDPLARVNVMTYRRGEALNWHFDRSEFTTTLLLREPTGGGQFQFRRNLRSDDDPNYNGVAALLDGQDDLVQTLNLGAGDLNVFRGKHTAHRVTPVEGDQPRVVAVFSYYEKPGRVFSVQEQVGFYGRSLQPGTD